METHRPRPPSTALHRKTDLRSIPPLLDRLDDLGVADVELGDPPQRLLHDRLLGNELRFVGDMLQLAAAAVILHVVGARCGNAGRAVARCSSARSAAATTSGRVSSAGTSPTWRRVPARSR